MSGVAAAADDHCGRESWSELIFRCTVAAILGFSTQLALLSIPHFFGALSLFVQTISSVAVLLIAVTVGQFVRRFFGVHASVPTFSAFHMIFMWFAFSIIVGQEAVSPLHYILFNGIFSLVLNSFFRMLFRDPGFVSVAKDSTKELFNLLQETTYTINGCTVYLISGVTNDVHQANNTRFQISKDCCCCPVIHPASSKLSQWQFRHYPWSLNRRRNLPLLLSTRCHLSFFSSCSLLLSPLICKIFPSSTSTLISSFFNPGRSTLNTWASGVSFQSTRVLANWEVSRAELGTLARVELRKPSNGSHKSRENGSKTLVFRPPKKLGTIDMFVWSVDEFLSLLKMYDYL